MSEWTAYMDESGRDEKSPHFVLMCVIGSPATLAMLARLIRAFKLGLVPERNPDSWELHGKEIWHGPDRKRGNSPLWPRTVAKKTAILKAVARLVGETDITLFCAVVNKEAMRQDHGSDTKIVEYAMTFLLERIELFLRENKVAKTVRVVSDHMRDDERRGAEKAISDLTRGLSAISHIRAEHITGIGYDDSLSNEIIQVADVMAYIVNRHIRGDEAMDEVLAKVKRKVWEPGGEGGVDVF